MRFFAEFLDCIAVTEKWKGEAAVALFGFQHAVI